LRAFLTFSPFTDDYRAHTSCISEAERYEGKLAKPKKRNPQQEWMDIVASCVATAPPHLRNFLTDMSSLDNIPRKEKQFHNFTANSLSLRANQAVVGEIWAVLKEERNKRQALKEQQQQQQKEKLEKQREDKEKSQEPKDKQEVESSDDDNSQSGENPKSEANESSEGAVDPKKVKKAMKKALKKAPNRSMKIKALRRVLTDKLGLPKSARKRLKVLLLQEASTTSKKATIKVDGKTITLA
jgi:cell growth-regulating nucleolar protein